MEHTRLSLHTRTSLLQRYTDAQKKFEKACDQILVLDQQIRDLEVRYKRAVKFKKNSFRYNLRLKLSVMTGAKMMFHHYASTKADEMWRLRRRNSGEDEDEEDAGDEADTDDGVIWEEEGGVGPDSPITGSSSSGEEPAVDSDTGPSEEQPGTSSNGEPCEAAR